jgi:hypothetical protein
MPEETNGTEQEQQGSDGETQGRLQGALPLVVGIAAAAAAGTIAVVARKALSGEKDGRAGKGDQGERDATSFEDLDQVAEDLSRLVDQLRSAVASEGEHDFQRLVEIADTISEYADQAASAFDAAGSGSDENTGTGGRVTDDLMSRVQGLTAKAREQVSVGSSGGADRDRQRFAVRGVGMIGLLGARVAHLAEEEDVACQL